MDHDTSDILGQKPRLRTDATRRSAFSFSMTQAAYTAVVIVGLIVVSRRIWKRVLMWREQSYRLATRRRHGIPDSDQRPFNVAYSEAMTRARDEQNRRPPRPRPSFRPQPPQLDQRQALQEQQNLRSRTAAPLRSDSDRYPSVLPVPGRFSAGSYDTTSQAYVGNDPMFVASGVNGSAKNGLIRHDGFIDIYECDASSDDEIKKGAVEQDLGEEHEVKDSRVEVDGMIDRDEGAESKNLAPKRGSKRGIHDDENDDSVRLKKSGGKRARKVSQNHDMDVDDEEADEITELKSTTRGKKRDRAEAGSTFGGDDEDSEDGQDVDVNAKARRRRKRRTVAKRKSEATYARGKKRDREDGEDSNDNFSEESSPERKPSHKKGKRTSKGGHQSHHDKASKSDVSMDESVTSTRSKVRSIGDEWESNGIRYKIGPNGQRLRQALVKKARPRFVMPKDSLHPDRDVNFQVCIETWLTEEEYQEAKAQQILAWQDSPSEKEPKKQLSLDISQASSVPQVPTSGKNLLWSSTTTTPTSSPGPQSPPPESLRYRGSRHSIATAGELPYNPFTQSRLPISTKRIASNTRLSLLNGSPGLSDSTNGSPRRIYSKWEKQELEAQALMKIREANKKKEMEKEAKLKEEKDRADRLAAEQQRLQQERERAERERAERERAERERAEAERKRKEEAAKAAAVPNITVTAPSAQPGQTPAPATNGPVPNNLFSVPSAAPGSSPFGMPKLAQVTGGQPAPAPSLFGNPAQPSSNATQPPSTGFSFNPSGTTATTSAPSSFFAPPPKKEEASTNASTNPQGPSLLSRLGTQAPEAPKTQTQPTTAPLFSFPKADSSSSGGATLNTSQPATGAAFAPSTGGSALKFNFGVPNKTTPPTPAPATNTTAAPTATSSSTPSSLSGALGMEPPKAATSPAPNPLFSFKTPTTPASAMTNGNAAAAAAASTTPASTTPLVAPKFNFGQTAFGAQAASGTSSSSSTQNKEPVKTAFGNVPATSAFGNTNANMSAFGNTNSSTSAFGNTNTNSTPAFGNSTSTSAFRNTNSTPAFGNTTSTSAFGNTKSTSAFGNTTTPAFGKTSAFGNAPGSGPSLFGATAFGGGSTGNSAAGGSKPAEESTPAPKLTFNFGGNTSLTPASANAGSSEAKTAFPSAASSTLAGATSTPASTTTATPFSFKFGQPSSTTPASSPFGAPASGQSAFGNLAGTSSTTPSVFGSMAFGAPTQSK